MRKMELLAPAGSLAILKAVVAAGADAVYVGGSMFSARAYATNFNKDELLEAIDYCHIHGVKIHMTVNTCLKNLEINTLLEYLKDYYEAGLDAVIVQDMGVFTLIRDNFPDLEIHASTQTTLTTKEGVALMRELGATRAVLARELSIPEIKSIHKANPDIEIETFIHGALCFSYSGQCLFSGFLGGRSGNRGRCAGPCRLAYSVEKDGKTAYREKYPLSLKDFCGVNHLKELYDAGVASLKIEGRMKSVEYAYGVTALYRHALDCMYAGKDFDVYKELMELGNRSGFTDGYLIKHNGADMVSINSPAHKSDKQALTSIEYKKKNIKLAARFVLEEVPVIEAFCDEIHVSVSGDNVIEKAKNAPTTYDEVKKTILQLGDTDFFADELDLSVEDDLFIPKGVIKKLRRQAVDLLKAKILDNSRRKCNSLSYPVLPTYKSDNSGVCVVVDNTEQLDIVIEFIWVDLIIVPMELLTSDIIDRIDSKGKYCGLSLPAVIRDDKMRIDELVSEINSYRNKVDFFLTNTYDGIGVLKKAGVTSDQIIAGANLYTYNNYAVSALKEFADLLTVPLELSIGEISHRNNVDSMLTVYGHAPFMVTAQCINGNCFGCSKKPENISLVDRKNMSLPVKNYCKDCYNIIYNPKPTILFDDIKSIEKSGITMHRIDFTVESYVEVLNVLNCYENEVFGEDNPFREMEFTRGHYRKGVE